CSEVAEQIAESCWKKARGESDAEIKLQASLLAWRKDPERTKTPAAASAPAAAPKASAPDLTPEPQSTAATTKSEAVPESAGKGGPPRFWIPDKALDQALTPHEFTVYAVLCRTAGKSRRCWPSITTIVRHGRMKRHTAVAALDALETRGMIECRKRFQKTS